MLHGNTTVRMQKEKIYISVGTKSMTVTCDFWFKNEGEATTIRMGFPDEGWGGYNPYGDGEPEKPLRAHSTFEWFKCWVDGKTTSTEQVPVNENGYRIFHTKTVQFAKGESKHVRDQYKVMMGGGACFPDNGYISQVAYTIISGASWKGTIGSGEFIIHFDKSYLTHGLKPQAFKPKNENDSPFRRPWKKLPKSTLYYTGLSNPTWNGKELKFTATNYEPKEDLFLYFNYTPIGR